MKFVFVLAIIASVSACAPLVGGIVGAAVSPIIEPLIDRALGQVHGKWVDPGGVEAVQSYDNPPKDDNKDNKN